MPTFLFRTLLFCTLTNLLTNAQLPFLDAGTVYHRDKLLAVPTARVTHMLAPLAFSTGLSLLGALPPNPLFSPPYTFFLIVHVIFSRVFTIVLVLQQLLTIVGAGTTISQ
jgi:hypothetical protein